MPSFFMYLVGCLFFEGCKKTEYAVYNEKCAANNEDDIKAVAECNDETDHNGEKREKKTENGDSASECIDQRDQALYCDQNTENEKDDLCSCPTENQNCNTDDKTGCTADPVSLEQVKDTGNDEDDSCNGHCPVKCLTAENDQKHAENDIQKCGKKMRIRFFLCHDETPFCKIFLHHYSIYIYGNQYIFRFFCVFQNLFRHTIHCVEQFNRFVIEYILTHQNDKRQDGFINDRCNTHGFVI